MTEDNPYAAPKAELDDFAFYDPRRLELAGRGTRLVAAFLDGLISWIWTFPMMYVIRGYGFRVTATGQSGNLMVMIVVSVMSFVCWFLVHGYTLQRSGQTLGKMVTGIRIADFDGRVPSLGASLGCAIFPFLLSA